MVLPVTRDRYETLFVCLFFVPTPRGSVGRRNVVQDGAEAGACVHTDSF